MLRLKEIRNQKRMTLDELSEKSGVSKRMISLYEANTSDITYTKMKQLSDALGIHVLELTGEYVEKEAPAANLPDVNFLVDKLAKKEKEIQVYVEMNSLYKRQIQILEDHNKGLLTTVQLLEEKVLDLSTRLIEYESKARGNAQSA